MRVAILSILAVSAALVSCGVGDGDRCPDGLEYVPERVACACPDGMPYNFETYACEEKPAVDTAQPLEGGFGVSCTQDDGCTAQTVAKSCIVDPTTNQGYCSVKGCPANSCPSSYRCCDCSNFSLLGWVACVKPADAEMVQPFGCTCSP